MLLCAGTDGNGRDILLAPRGLEHTSLALAKTPISPSDSAPDSAPNGQNTLVDPDLARLIEAWPKLTADTRATILREAGL
jgi:hypothetical protein